jgi:hypothetical protein
MDHRGHHQVRAAAFSVINQDGYAEIEMAVVFTEHHLIGAPVVDAKEVHAITPTGAQGGG